MKRFFVLCCASFALISICRASPVPRVADCILHLSVENSDIGTTERVVWFAPDGVSYVLFDGIGATINGVRKLSLSLAPAEAGPYTFSPGPPWGLSTISSAAIIPWKSSSSLLFSYLISDPQPWSRGAISSKTSVDIDWGLPAVGSINCSNKSYLTPGKPSTAGFVLTGQPRWVLVRAISKSLKPYGITSNVKSLSMKIFDANGLLMGDGVSWCASDEHSKLFKALFRHVSAFQLTEGSNEPVFLAQLPEGAYTVQVESNDVAGDVLTEIYLTSYSASGL